VLRAGQIQGEALLFLVFKLNLNPSLDASNTLTIFENGLEMSNLQPFKVRGSRTQKKKKKQTIKHYKKLIPKHT
jgi:hypothetical protein